MNFLVSIHTSAPRTLDYWGYIHSPLESRFRGPWYIVSPVTAVAPLMVNMVIAASECLVQVIVRFIFCSSSVYRSRLASCVCMYERIKQVFIRRQYTADN